MRRTSPERQQILDALAEAQEPLEPRDIAAATGMDPANVRRLLHAMRTAGLITPKQHGTRTAYAVTEDTVTATEDTVTVSEDAVTATEESPIDKPSRSVTAGVIGAYSVLDGGSISNAELRRRKGYLD